MKENKVIVAKPGRIMSNFRSGKSDTGKTNKENIQWFKTQFLNL